MNRPLLLGTIGLFLLVSRPALANPSHDVPDALWPVHGTEFSPELHRLAAGNYATIKRKLTDFLEREKQQAIQRIGAEDLGETHVAATRLGRAADQLVQLGEPTGKELQLRVHEIHDHLGRLIQSSLSIPATQKYANNFRQWLSKNGAARAKAVADLEKLASQQKWEDGEMLLYKVFDRLAVGTVFLSPPENETIYKPFAQVSAAITSSMHTIRERKAKELLDAAADRRAPNYDAIRTDIDAALAGFADAETVMWDGESVTGPQLIAGLGQRWQQMLVAALQTRATRWAQNDWSMASSDGLDAARDSWSQAYHDGAERFGQAMGRIVELDADRITADQVEAHYAAYLAAFSDIRRWTGADGFPASVPLAMQKLAGKNPMFGGNVSAYDLATKELLRWRARAASAEAAAASERYASVEQVLISATTSRPDYVGLLPPPPAAATPSLLDSAPDVLAGALPKLMGIKVQVRDVTRVGAESRTSIARYRGRTYANVPAPLDVARHIDALKQDLLVSDGAPPLTLEAVAALRSSEWGDWAAAGGTISGVYLESVVTRFATLPPAAAVLVPLSDLPTETFSGGSLSAALLRFELAPEWVQHEFFFADFSAPLHATAQQR